MAADKVTMIDATELKHKPNQTRTKTSNKTRLGHKLNTTDSEIELCKKAKHGLDRRNPRLLFFWLFRG